MNLIISILAFIGSFTAQFTQTKQSEMLAEMQTSSGMLTYRSPDYLRWEYTTPQVLVWELDGEQGNMNRQIKSMVMLIRQAVSGDLTAAAADFDIQQDDTHVILRPKKRELKRMFTQIDIYLNSAIRIADRVIISETNGDITTIVFYDVKME